MDGGDKSIYIFLVLFSSRTFVRVFMSYWSMLEPLCSSGFSSKVELVSRELNHLAAILHVYAGGLNFMKQKKKIVIILKKENGNTFTLLIIFIVKSLQKEQNSTNLPATMTPNLPE